MRKMLPVRCIAAAALLGSAGLAVVLPASIAGAKTPVTASCTGLLGGATSQLLSGCAATSGAPKISPYGVSVPNGTDTGGTIYWTDKTDTTVTFGYVTVTDTCGTYLDQASALEEQETETVTGGNSKLTTGAQPSSNVCVYIGSSDGTVLIVGGSVCF